MTFPFIAKAFPLVLASASPRRRRLLEQIAVPYRVVESGLDEETFNGKPEETSCRLAEAKAAYVHSLEEAGWILGADTMVVTEREVLGKPGDGEGARRMLRVLSGKTHQVITGYALLDPSGALVHSEAVATDVQFRTLDEAEIAAYVSTGEPFGKAGSYAIQGIGAFMVEEIRGDYSNVVGLPLCALVKALLSVGALEVFPGTP